MSAKRCVLIILAIPAMFYLLLIIVDPFAVIHNHGFRMHGKEMRLMAAGAINDGKYDSFIVGTSMLQNCSARELEKLMPKTRFANISMPGSSFYERSFILDYVFTNKLKVKNIIYSLDDHYFDQRMERTTYPIANYVYLYDKNKLNDGKLYFSFLTVKTIADYITHFKEYQNDENIQDYNMPNRYGEGEMMLLGGLDSWFKHHDNRTIKNTLAEIDELRNKFMHGEKIKFSSDKEREKAISAAINYCREYVLKYVDKEKETDFYLFFPPYSRLRYAQWYQYNIKNAEMYFAVVKFFVEEAAKRGNMYVFGFDNDDFLDDISVYIDMAHYEPDKNSYMNREMSAKRHLLTPQNMNTYLEEAKKRGEEFDFLAVADRVHDFLNDLKKKK